MAVKESGTALTHFHGGFVMSTEAGLQTQYLNWRKGLSPEMGIVPAWIVVDWWQEGGWLERLPAIPRGVKSRLRAYQQVKTGLKQGPFDFLFIAATDVFYGQGQQLKRQPYFINLDSTWKSFEVFSHFYDKSPSRSRWYEQRKHSMRREMIRNALALFPWSNWAANSLIEDYGADPKKVHVIPPGVDLDLWKSPPRRYDTKWTNLLFVGGDFHRKGGDLLLNWAAKTRSSNWRLHLVTRDSVTPSHENVRVYQGLSSNDPELVKLYHSADLFLLPTRGDCYSLASIEAMAAGLPVILSRTGGTADIVQEQVTGFLIDPMDEKALSERLEFLLAHPEQRIEMGLAARKDAEARYDVQNNIQRTIDIIVSALKA
jgi:glycosyltransferase involved in cell wall biosynthesis